MVMSPAGAAEIASVASAAQPLETGHTLNAPCKGARRQQYVAGIGASVLRAPLGRVSRTVRGPVAARYALATGYLLPRLRRSRYVT
jgi:hypothetical protein